MSKVRLLDYTRVWYFGMRCPVIVIYGNRTRYARRRAAAWPHVNMWIPRRKDVHNPLGKRL